MLTVLTQKPPFPVILLRLADAEDTIDRWKPFSSLAVPASSAATPVRRSPHLVGSQSRSTISPEATCQSASKFDPRLGKSRLRMPNDSRSVLCTTASAKGRVRGEGIFCLSQET